MGSEHLSHDFSGLSGSTTDTDANGLKGFFLILRGALAAGNDMLLEISDVPGTVAAIEKALADGTLSRAALDESVLRILQLKLAHGIVDMPESG